MSYFNILTILAFVTNLLANNTMFKTGEDIYKQTCISCHGIDGKAKVDMKLIVRPRDLSKTILTEHQSYLIIKDGAKHWGAKADIMPAFKYVLNKQQLKSITYYISLNFNPNIKERTTKLLAQSTLEQTSNINKMKKWGRKIFHRNCKYCHGIDGKGDGIATKNPENSIYPYDLTKTLLTKEQMFLYIKYGGHYFGTYKKDMPSWKRKYNDFKLYSVAKYVDEIIRKENNK